MPARETTHFESVCERLEAVPFDALTLAERTLLTVEVLLNEVHNGGLHQFFHNSSGEYAAEALEGLTAIGATGAAEVLAFAISLFPDGLVPTDREYRWEAMESVEGFEDKLDQAESAPYEQTWDEAARLLEAFANAHEASFLGPRSHLELWYSQRARGADTQPNDYRKVDMAKEAIIDARYTDRVCPHCAQPAPAYRAFCKRCGYPYGKASG